MEFELIHANLSLAKYSHNHELVSTFWSREESIYDQAKTFDGFVRDIDFPDCFSEFPEPYVLNATAWNDFDDLKNFVYTGLHAEALKIRAEWFTEHKYPKYVLLWHPAGS